MAKATYYEISNFDQSKELTDLNKQAKPVYHPPVRRTVF